MDKPPTIPQLLRKAPRTFDELGDYPKPRYSDIIVHKLKVAHTRNPTKEKPTIRGNITTVYFVPGQEDEAIRRFTGENLDILLQIDFSQNNFLNSSFTIKTVRKIHAEIDMIMAKDLQLITLEIAIKAGTSCMDESISHEKRSKSPDWTRIRMLEICRERLQKCI